MTLLMQDSAQQDDQSQNVPKVQTVPQPPVSTPLGSKEHAPIGGAHPEYYLQPAPHEATAQIPKEAAEHGVEAAENKDQPKLSNEDRKLGVKEAKESTPPPEMLSDSVSYPMSQQAATVAAKDGKTTDSRKWLALLILKDIKRRFLQAVKDMFKKP